MNTEDLARRTVLLKSELSDEMVEDLNWGSSKFSSGSIPEFKFIGEYIYRAPTSDSAYGWVGFIAFWSVLMVVQEWSAFNALILVILSMLALLLTAYLVFLYMRKNQFDFYRKTYEKHTLSMFGYKLQTVKFDEIRALQLIKIDKDYSNDIDEQYEMYLVKMDGSRIFIANMLSRFYFLVAAMNVHNRTNIPLWMNKWN